MCLYYKNENNQNNLSHILILSLQQHGSARKPAQIIKTQKIQVFYKVNKIKGQPTKKGHSREPRIEKNALLPTHPYQKSLPDNFSLPSSLFLRLLHQFKHPIHDWPLCSKPTLSLPPETTHPRHMVSRGVPRGVSRVHGVRIRGDDFRLLHPSKEEDEVQDEATGL